MTTTRTTTRTHTQAHSYTLTRRYITLSRCDRPRSDPGFRSKGLNAESGLVYVHFIYVATLSKIREGSSVPSSVVALTTRWQRWWCPWRKRRSRRTGRWTAWRFHTVKAVRFLQQLRIAAPPTTEIYVSALSAIHKSFATTIFLFESRIIYPFARVVILFFLILFVYTKFIYNFYV